MKAKQGKLPSGKRQRQSIKGTGNPIEPRPKRRKSVARLLKKPLWEHFELAVGGARPMQHAHRVEKLLSGAEGVKRVKAQPEPRHVVAITYDARVTDPAQLHENLLAAGYKPSPRAD